MAENSEPASQSPVPAEPLKKPKRFLASPPLPVPNRRIVLRLFLVALALTLTLGYLGIIVPDYADWCALPLNLGCWIILFLAWRVPIRIPKKLSRVTIALLASVLPLMVAGQWNVERTEGKLRQEIQARVVQRLGMSPQAYWQEMNEREKRSGVPTAHYASDFVDDKERPLLLKRIEERQPGWPRALGRLLPYTDVNVLDRSFRERYDRPYSFCATFMGGPFDLTRLTVLRVSLRAEDRLLSCAEQDRELFLPAWKKLQESEGR